MAKLDYEGLDEITNFFEDVGEEVAAADKEALSAGGQIIAERQRELVSLSSKDHPHIKDNITVSRTSESKDGEKYVSVGPNKKVAWRALFLENGTSKMQAYPFIEPGAAEAEDDAYRAMESIYLGKIK